MSDRPSYEAPWREERDRVEGAPAFFPEAAWEEAPWVKLLPSSPEPPPSPPATGTRTGPHASASFRLLVSATHIYLDARLHTPTPHLDPARPRHEKSPGLWDYDVAELFLSPSETGLPYGEVEGSPLGQFLDYWVRAPRLDVDTAWTSGVEVRGSQPAHLETAAHRVSLRVPFQSFGIHAAPGLRLRMNVYAALGPPAARRYLAFSPTRTERPDFHVPAAFGELRL